MLHKFATKSGLFSDEFANAVLPSKGCCDKFGTEEEEEEELLELALSILDEPSLKVLISL